MAYGFIRELAARGHELHIAAERVDLSEPAAANVRIHALGRAPGCAKPASCGECRASIGCPDRALRRRAPAQPVHAGLTLALADQPVPIVLGPYVPDWPGFRSRVVPSSAPSSFAPTT